MIGTRIRHGYVLFILVGMGTLFAQSAQTPQEIFNSIDWQVGPTDAHLGTYSAIQIPEGFLFTGPEGTRTFLELAENLPSGSELGLILEIDSGWFVIFEFDAIGYVSDDEKDSLDADAILESIREGTDRANQEAIARGWGTMEVVGWQHPPHYNEQTHNLEWAILGRNSAGGLSANFNTRLLGRRGVMNATLVAGAEELEAVLPSYSGVLDTFSFSAGESYAEYRKGDRVAEYGLSALITGGAVAVAAKTGLLKKFWKFIVFGVVALLGFLRKLLGGSKGQAISS